MKLTITEKHLDAAIAVPWKTTTCLVAQAICEYAGEPAFVCGHGSTQMVSGRTFDWLDANWLSQEFDKAFWLGVTTEEQDERLRVLRAKLPIVIEVNEYLKENE